MKAGLLADGANFPRVAYQGEPGAFSEEAAQRLFRDGCALVPCATFERLFAALSEGTADYLVAPLENSTAGFVMRCCELLRESQLTIVNEIVLPIAHCVIGCRSAAFEELTMIESHPVALKQCERFFAAHPHLTRVEGVDTAGSVRSVVARGDSTRAAIASKRAASIYGGAILREHVEDFPDNRTRFALLASQEREHTALKIFTN